MTPLLRSFVLMLLACLGHTAIFAQATDAQADYERRTRQQKIGTHYIPADLNDAMATLDRLTSMDSQEKYAAQSEDFVVERLFFSFGRWIAINWGLYDGSRFSLYLKKIGVDQPDGQKEFIMRAYHRHLTGKPLDVKDLVTRYKVKKVAADSVKMANARVLETYTVKVDSSKVDTVSRQ